MTPVSLFDRSSCCRGDPSARVAGILLIVFATFLFAGCEGPMSTLDPAGRAAQSVLELFWWLVGGAAILWVVVIGLAVYAIRVNPRPHDRRRAAILIIGGGAVLPTFILTGYLIFGLAMLPGILEPAPEGSLRIHVTGEQWWWRVRYLPGDGESVELANEIRMPVGEPVEFILDSPDVIHSFWIPSIGGKMDMVPGRVNRLTLEATRTGTFRGVCAEYCGESHALMAFDAVVMERDEFDAWLARQASPAGSVADARVAAGRDAFLANGCGACHRVRGTPADGVVGPDLTHVGSRLSIGASILPNDRDAILQWVAATDAIKPGVHMPAFGMLPEDELLAIATYLEALQ